MPRLAAVLALASLAATTGCSRNAMLATGGVMAITGIAMAARPNTTTTHEGFLDGHGTWEEENYDYDIAGGILTVVGAAVLLAGAVSRDDHDRHPVTVVPQPYYYYPPAAYTPYVPAAPEPQPPGPAQTVVNAPNAQTVIFADTVVVEPATPVVVNPATDDLP